MPVPSAPGTPPGDAPRTPRPPVAGRVAGRVAARVAARVTGRVTGGVVRRATVLLARWRRTRVARAVARFRLAQGGLLCGGLAYTALFALFGALAIGYTIFTAVLGGDEDLRDSLFDQVDRAVPGLVDTGGGGAIQPDQLVLSASSVAGAIAVLVLLWSALAFMSALRRAVRVMLGFDRDPAGFAVGKLRDLGGFAVLLVAMLASTAVGVAATAAAGWFVRTLDLPPTATWVFRVAGLLVAAVVDALVVLYVLRVLGGSRAGWPDTVRAVSLAAVALGVLRYLGTALVVESASRNALLAGFAALVTVLLLVNVVARVLLLVAAWLADPPASDVYPEPGARTPTAGAPAAGAGESRPSRRRAALRTRA